MRPNAHALSSCTLPPPSWTFLAVNKDLLNMRLGAGYYLHRWLFFILTWFFMPG